MGTNKAVDGNFHGEEAAERDGERMMNGRLEYEYSLLHSAICKGMII